MNASKNDVGNAHVHTKKVRSIYLVDTADNDYFLHFAGMRNTPKMKALRRKFGLGGYAIWVALLEKLSSSEDQKFKYSSWLDRELLAGDILFVEPELLDSVIQYLIKIEVLRVSGAFIYSIDRIITNKDLAA